MVDMEEPSAKRRKVRKGTKSCWACRRRKIKCEYSSPDAESCLPCISRSADCVSQEFDDAPPGKAAAANAADPTASERHLVSRLSHLESMMRNFVDGREEGHDDGCGSDYEDRIPIELRPKNLRALELDLLDSSAVTNAQDVAKSYTNQSNPNAQLPSPEYSTPSSSSTCFPKHPQAPTTHARRKHYLEISRHLYSLLPPLDIRAILAYHSPGAAFVLDTFSCFTDRVAGKNDTVEALCSPGSPSPTSHPALLAKRLLQLTICVQRLPPNFDITRLRLGNKLPCESMSVWTHAVVSLVTSNDDLIGSIEGLECLALLSIFQGDAGHLRKAWMSTRRALSMAQLMGINRRHPPPLRSCDPLGSKITPSTLWFRINCTDRYHSLILGLPVGTKSNSFADQARQADDDNLDVLTKVFAVTAARIADRNDILSSSAAESGNSEAYAITQSVDLDLERATRIMGDAWWELPDLNTALRFTTSDDGRSFADATHTMRIQVSHYSLLILLHLPYLLKERQEKRYAYNRTTALRASRAVLARFLEFRSIFIGTVTGRHIDYSALIGAMTLCLGYLGPERDEEQRRSDRSLVEKVHRKLHEMCLAKGDKLAKESSDTIKELLPILQREDGSPDKTGQDVHLTVPFLGTVKIHSQPEPEPEPITASNSSQTMGFPDTISFTGNFDAEVPLSLSFDTNAIPPPLPQMDSQTPPAMDLANFELLTDPSWSEFQADLDEWVFQGVDTTYWSMLNQTMP